MYRRILDVAQAVRGKKTRAGGGRLTEAGPEQAGAKCSDEAGENEASSPEGYGPRMTDFELERDAA